MRAVLRFSDIWNSSLAGQLAIRQYTVNLIRRGNDNKTISFITYAVYTNYDVSLCYEYTGIL
jgi:hypothetical protein